MTLKCLCDGRCRRGGCEAVDERGVLRDGATIVTNMMMTDAARSPNPERKPLHMMTDTEKRGMRDSVPSMSVADAAKLPIYDDVRGLSANGMPAEEYHAAMDGAGGADVAKAFARRDAAYDSQEDHQPAALRSVQSSAGDVFADREAAFAELLAYEQTAHVKR